MIVLNLVSSWFRRKNLLLLDLGNCFIRATLFKIRGNNALIEEERSFKIDGYYNGRTKDKKLFIEQVRAGLYDLELPQDIIIGIDSSHLTYKCFQFDQKNERIEILSKIEADQDKKIIHSSFDRDRACVLLINKPILNELAAAFSEAGISVSKFVAIKAFAQGSGLRTVVDIGYKTTNTAIFHANFLLSYRTTEIGMERILLSIAEKFSISLEDARMAIQQTELFERENTKWLAAKENYMNKRHLSTFTRIYLEAFLKKVLGQQDLQNVFLTGWAKKISGITNILENTSYLNPSQKTEMIMRMF